VPVAKLRRQISPGSTGSGNPEDSFNKLPVIFRGNTTVRGFSREHVCDAIPLIISKYVSVHVG
jgi:hypothetical protein